MKNKLTTIQVRNAPATGTLSDGGGLILVRRMGAVRDRGRGECSAISERKEMMHLSRRNILSLFAAAPVATPSIARQSTATGVGLLSNEPLNIATSSAPIGLESDIGWKVSYQLYEVDDIRREASMERMPVRITSKRSWSPAFREDVFIRERVATSRFRKRIERDDTFASKVAKMMGID